MGRWWASSKRVFGDGEDDEDDGKVGCFSRIGRKLSRNPYADTTDPEAKRARRRRPRGGGGVDGGGAGGAAAGGERDHGVLLGREAHRPGLLRQGVPRHDAGRPPRRREAPREALQARLQRRLLPAALRGVPAPARQLRPPPGVHHQQRPPRAGLRVRHHGHTPRRPARRQGGAGRAAAAAAGAGRRRRRQAGAELDPPREHRAGRGEGAAVPARDGAAGGDAQGRAVHQRAAVRRVQGQDRRLQHVQPGRGHGQAQPLHAHARVLRLPGARVRHDGADDGQERRVQLRDRSAGAPHGEEAVGQDAAAGAAKPGQLGNSNADGRQGSGVHRPEAWRSVSSCRSSQARADRCAMPPVRPHLPAVHGHRRPRDQLRRLARPAGRGLMAARVKMPSFAVVHRPL